MKFTGAVVWISALLLYCAGDLHAQVPGQITKVGGGDPIRGTITYRASSRTYNVARGGVSMTIPADQVDTILVQKPREMDAALAAVRAGRGAQAIPVLEKIFNSYIGLQWDVVAARALAEAYLQAKNGDKAIEYCERVISVNKNVSADLLGVYWDALLLGEKYDRLRRAITEAIEKGSREQQAVAQIKRGDIDRKQGNLKQALVDGYLRTILLYEQIKSVQPEALYKAIKCHEELNESHHAEKWRKKLLQEYPASPEADKIRTGA